jgi:hypothetical protein
MHKKHALIVAQGSFKEMERQHLKNRDLGARGVIEHLFGKQATIVWRAGSTGSSCGSSRVARSGCFAGYPASVNPSSAVSKIIGLTKRQRNISIYPWSVISSMTAPISIRTAAC